MDIADLEHFTITERSVRWCCPKLLLSFLLYDCGVIGSCCFLKLGAPRAPCLLRIQKQRMSRAEMPSVLTQYWVQGSLRLWNLALPECESYSPEAVSEFWPIAGILFCSPSNPFHEFSRVWGCPSLTWSSDPDPFPETSHLLGCLSSYRHCSVLWEIAVVPTKALLAISHLFPCEESDC